MIRAHLSLALAPLFFAGCFDFESDYRACIEHGWCGTSDAGPGDGALAGSDAGDAANGCGFHSPDGRPFMCIAPQIFGEPRTGNTIVLDPGEFSDATAITVEWRRLSFANPSGTTLEATDDTYVVSMLDTDDRLTAIVSASNNVGTTTIAAPPTERVLRNASPSLLYFTGFEAGTRNAFDESMFDGIFGGADVVSDAARSGQFSLAVFNAGGFVGNMQRSLPAGQTKVGVRFAILRRSASSPVRIASVHSANGETVFLTLENDGHVVADAFSGGGPVRSTTVILPDTWYVIDLLLDWTRQTGCAWRIGGEPQPDLVAVRLADTVTNVVIGSDNATPPDRIWFDDFAISNSGPDSLNPPYPIGDAHIVALVPNASGAHHFELPEMFSKYTGLCAVNETFDANERGSFDALDERPPDGAMQIGQVRPSQVSYVEYELEELPAVIPDAVRPIFALSSCGMGVDVSAGCAVVIDGVETMFDARNVSLPIYESHIIPAIGWNLDTLAGMRVRFGYSADVGMRIPTVDAILVEVHAPDRSP